MQLVRNPKVPPRSPECNPRKRVRLRAVQPPRPGRAGPRESEQGV